MYPAGTTTGGIEHSQFDLFEAAGFLMESKSIIIAMISTLSVIISCGSILVILK